MRRRLALSSLLLLLAAPALGNDAAVETAAGGLRLTSERSVKMLSERLSISPSLVRVDYVFRNTTGAAVTSEVGFPVPPMTWTFDDTGGPRGFDDFHAWLDGVPANLTKEARAFVGSREVTDDLRRARIGIETFGKFDPSAKDPASADDIQRVPTAVKERLATLGALRRPTRKDHPGLYEPAWEARVTYHWTQTFPPGKDLHVHHEYKPVIGFAMTRVDELVKRHPGACVDEGTRREIDTRVAAMTPRENGYLRARWVKYILTTANTWQTPIGDFELTVERPKGSLVSFCWDGPVEKGGADRFIARKKFFVPARELEVLFLSFP